jgi:NADPH2:quinone reductase
MKAIRVRRPGGPEVLRLEEIPEPGVGPGEVLVRLEAIGINFIEIYQREGLYPTPTPYTPGREGAGVVVAVGPGVTRVELGDRVASESFKGSYAEYASIGEERVVVLPPAIDTRTAAGMMLQGLTAHYLATSTHPLAVGETCLVHAAAGGVGLLLCQIATQRGAAVIGTTSTEAKAALAREAGAKDVILYAEGDFAAEVRRLTGGSGVQVVYDSVGKTTFDASLDCLAPLGMLVLYGQSSGPVPPFDPQTLNRKGSLFLTRPTLAHYVATPEALADRARDLLAWVQKGTLRVRVDHTFPLAGAEAAHRALASRTTTGKALLLP